jgi:hypothetical protein
MHPLAPVILIVVAAGVLVTLLRMRIDEKRYRLRRDEMETIRVRHMNERDQRRRRFEMAVRTRERQRGGRQRTSRRHVPVHSNTPDTADPTLTANDWKAFLTGAETMAHAEPPAAAGRDG